MARSNQEWGQNTTFTKLVLDRGSGFLLLVVPFSFSVPFHISVSCRDCPSFVCGAGRGFYRNCPGSKGAPGAALDGGAGQEVPPDPSGLSCPDHGAPGGILCLSSISHPSLVLFPRSHTWSRSVKARRRCVCIVSLSPAPRPSPSASLGRLWEPGRVSPAQGGDRGHSAGTPWPRQAPRPVPVPASTAGPHHPPWLPAPSAMQPRVNICQKKILDDKRARGLSG